MKQPMKKGSFVPKNVPGVGWGGVRWGVSCRGGVGHEGVGWVMYGWGGWGRVGWGVSCRVGVGCVMKGWGGPCRGGVSHEGVGWVM